MEIAGDMDAKLSKLSKKTSLNRFHPTCTYLSANR